MVVDPTRSTRVFDEPVRDPRGVAETSPGGEPRVSRLVPLLGAEDYRQVLNAFRRELPAAATLEPHLAGAVADLLAAPGSLIRAQLAFGTGKALGLEVAAARALATAVEYLHTASLVFDDLPAMDDAVERRGRPCPHLLHGEGAAILAALAFVHRAHALVAQATFGQPEERARRAWECLESQIGLGGILDGQARDLHFSGIGDSASLAAGKTTPLLRLALLLPAIVAGVSPAIEATLDRIAAIFGDTYQALDDFRDLFESSAQSGKTAGRDRLLGRPNRVEALGAQEAWRTLDRNLVEARSAIEELAALPELVAPLARMRDLFVGESVRIAAELRSIE